MQAPLSLWYMGFSLQWLLLLRSSRHLGSIVMVPRLSCSTACGILLDQRSNLCLLLWRVDSLPLSHQEALELVFLSVFLSQDSVSLAYGQIHGYTQT